MRSTVEISPQDVQQKQFDQVKRGFDPQQVGAFLDQVAASLAKRDHTISEAYSQIEKLKKTDNETTDNQEAFRLTMTVATETMEEMLRMAGERAAAIEEEARTSAEFLVERSKVDVEDVAASLKREVASLQGEKARLEAHIGGLRDQGGESAVEAGSLDEQPSARRPLELVIDRPDGSHSDAGDAGDAGGTEGSGLASRVGDLRG